MQCIFPNLHLSDNDFLSVFVSGGQKTICFQGNQIVLGPTLQVRSAGRDIV
jgi:hypothetical protein